MSRTIAFVPCRGGSKRVPRKNLQRISNASLVDRAIVCAIKAGCEVVVSTDDAEIAGHAESWAEAEVHHRPEHLASDTAQIEDAIAHWMQRCSPTLADDDVIVIAQCTAPFRRPETIRACVDHIRTWGDEVCVAVTRDVQRTLFTGRIRGLWDEAQGRDVAHRVIWNCPPQYRPRTQDCRNYAVDRGTCWAMSARHFRSQGHRMAWRTGVVFVSQWEALDVDTPADLEAARVLAPHVERLMGLEGA